MGIIDYKLRDLVKFYGMLALLYFSDMVLLVGLIWNTYKVTKAPYFLGVVLSVSVLIPFIIRRFFNGINLLHLNFKKLFILRLCSYLLIAFVAISNFSDKYTETSIIIILYGILTLSTLSTFEAGNIKLVRSGIVSSLNASRLLQTVIQTGAFVGALISGLLLDKYSFHNIVLYISLYDILISIAGFIFLKDIASPPKTPNPESANSVNIISLPSLFTSQKLLICLIGLIGLHISSFNLLTPVIYQSLNHWGSEQFGIASGAACFGAFLSALLATKKWNYALAALLLVISDTVFCNIEIKSVNVASCFFLGLFLNLVRIGLRSEFIDSIAEGQSEEDLAAKITTVYSLCQAAGPIIMGFVISEHFLGVASARWLLTFVAICILIGIVVLNNVKKMPAEMKSA